MYKLRTTLATVLAIVAGSGCGESAGSRLEEALGEMETVVSALEGCQDSESLRKALPLLEKASDRMLDLSAETDDMSDEERDEFRRKYGERISDLSRRFLRQSARLAVKREFREIGGRVLRSLEGAWKRLARLKR